MLEGIVTDVTTGERMEYVNVGILGGSQGTTTNSRGFYRLTLPSGTDSVVVRFSFTGFENQQHKVRCAGRTEMDVSMKPSATQLHAVEVRDEKTRQRAFTPIAAEHLGDAVGPTAGVEGLLKTLPDVNSNNELSSRYSVRGGSFDENLVYINGIEVFRPMLIRSGQQEGMSIINSDLVEGILFSPGGFDASYGDRMSSALDITYHRPQQRKGVVSLSLLGGSVALQGRVGERWSYATGARLHNNEYLLGSMETEGSYTTHYLDWQTLLGYHVNERLDLALLAVVTSNVYGLVPESRTTTFGSALAGRLQELNIFFDGQEKDRYRTLLGAVSADWRPSDLWHIKAHLALQHIGESECYDVQSQYWLYELSQTSAGDSNRLNRGVGTFLEHARNRLTTDIITFDIKASRYAVLGSWNFGLTMQHEAIEDHLREWRWIDSAGYAMPIAFPSLGDSSNMPVPPMLQDFVKSSGSVEHGRFVGFVQREVNLLTPRGGEVTMLAGLRAHLYRTSFHHASQSTQSTTLFVSPRLSVSYKPHSVHDLLFRLAGGWYVQPPYYREYRRDDGSLCTTLAPQHSWQVAGTVDWRFRMWNKPFVFTGDLYYKYMPAVVPYTVDNLRLRYHPDLDARGYACGVSLRLNGELIEGLESWASLSLMQVREDIEGDGKGWLARPTDQRFSVKLFLQDNLPARPWWRMSLSLVYSTGLPVTNPFTGAVDEDLRLPSYYRVDWGNTIRLSQFEKLKHMSLFRLVDDVQIGIEVFNLFNFRNVISYLWVNDIEGIPWRVPNYLTARQLNLKVTVLF